VSEALTRGWGGVSRVSRATGRSQQVRRQMMKELQDQEPAGDGRKRRKGDGRTKRQYTELCVN
jgi:hypothetical protein